MKEDPHLKARAEGATMVAYAPKSLPACTNLIYPPHTPPHKGETLPASARKRCSTITVQNMIEIKRGTYWCPRCQQYPWGAGFGPDRVPKEAWLDEANNT